MTPYFFSLFSPLFAMLFSASHCLRRLVLAIGIGAGLAAGPVRAQSALAALPPAPPAQPLTLTQCVSYALRQQPAVRQALLDEEIGRRSIQAELAGWLPQVEGTGNYRRNLKLPVAVLPNFTDPSLPAQVIRIGLNNTSSLGLQANQTLFSNDLLLASRAARYTRQQNAQNTAGFRIEAVVNVSKAFYDILLTGEQIEVLDEAIRRQEKQLADTKAQFEEGLIDVTDFRRASVSVRNAYSARRTTAESLRGKYAALKQLMGVPPNSPLRLTSDSLQLVSETRLDTTEQLAFERRIEVQQLETSQQLQRLSITYNRMGFLPTLTGFANYVGVYQSQNIRDLYSQAFPPPSSAWICPLPIFTGLRRYQNRKIAELTQDRLTLDLQNLRSQISTEYEQAIGTYQGARNDWALQQANVVDARETYAITKLQYDEGIKAYLEVIVAENDLRQAQLNYYNALYQVLAAKLDVQRALGSISPTL
jgi:outer membrane protein TolC